MGRQQSSQLIEVDRLESGDLPRSVEEPGSSIEAWRRMRDLVHNPGALAASRRIMDRHGLSLGSVKALDRLPLQGSLPMSELAARLKCDTSYVTSLTDLLEEKGLARREAHPSDRRVKLIVLTDTGRRLARQLQKSWSKSPDFFSCLNEDELVALCGTLRKLEAAATDS